MIYGILIGASMMQFIDLFRELSGSQHLHDDHHDDVHDAWHSFVREVPSFFDWARDISLMGICSDLVMYLEFKNVDSKYGTAESIFSGTVYSLGTRSSSGTE